MARTRCQENREKIKSIRSVRKKPRSKCLYRMRGVKWSTKHTLILSDVLRNTNPLLEGIQMTYGSTSCSNPSNNTYDAYYLASSDPTCDPTIVTYYGSSGDTSYARMRDHLLGAASQFNLPSMVSLAQAIQENGGPLNDWMQLSSIAQSFISSFVTPNNNTGLTMSSSYVENADSINAAAGAWYLANNLGGSTTPWENMSLALNQYNKVPMTTWGMVTIMHMDFLCFSKRTGTPINPCHPWSTVYHM